MPSRTKVVFDVCVKLMLGGQCLDRKGGKPTSTETLGGRVRSRRENEREK